MVEGGKKRKTQTALQVLGKYASPKDKKTKHNIPKGGTTITPDDPYGGRLGTGEYDRGKGSKAKRRLAALQSNKPKNFPNRLRRADGQGIKDSYEFLSDYLIDEGYANSYEEADYILEDMSNIERKQLMMEATRMRKYFNKKYGNKNEYGENEAAAKEAITRRKISRNRTPYPHPPIRGSSEHLQFARQKAKSQNEAYELLLDYLIDEGYTNTVDGALTIIENMSDDWMESILDEELTGERRKRALKKGFKHLATAKEGSSVTKNRDSNLPTRRGGYGSSGGPRYKRGNTPGLAKVEVTGERESDRGSGNEANRRAGKKVKDNEDRYYWNDTDPDF